MAPPPSALYSLSFVIALLATIIVAATLRLLAILPYRHPQTTPWRKRPIATRILIVLGSGGHTHEMFYLLKDLDTRKYTHRTYVVSSGDAFSAQRAADFEAQLEQREKQRAKERQQPVPDITITKATAHAPPHKRAQSRTLDQERPACTGPKHYTIATIPRARRIHQPLLTTPLSCLRTLLSAFTILLPPSIPATDPYTAASLDCPDLIITNGPATAVVLVLAAFLLRFFDVRGAHSRGKCKAIYVESFARVRTLSLSGKMLCWVVDRFLVQWEALADGRRAEYHGILV
ncbi:UDP-N-acetylglucosamine transferase subunit [Coniothyrium glycines]